jgi:hypothetical protein
MAARDLHVTSPLMSGPDVLAVQKKLQALGYSSGVLDGAYGPTTAAAVKAFQKARRLAADGVVGPNTRKALTATKPSTSVPPAVTGSTLGQAALTEALKHLGATEKPAGSNRNEFGAWFGVNGVPWCNIFVSFCFTEGAGYTIAKGFKGAGCTAMGCTYVPTTEAWLRATGMWIGRVAPQPGDIAIYNWDGGAPDHIGIVESDAGNGSFTAIEGNTSVGNDSNGGEVMRRERYLTQVDGFGRVTK